MDVRHIGRSGLQVSAVGLGCGNFGWVNDAEETCAIVHRALDLGVTLFDTSDYYGAGASEEFLGAALGERRKAVVVATKFGMPRNGAGTFDRPSSGDGSRREIMSAVEGSLRRLKTDWIDLYQLHWPDVATPIEETLRALEDLIRQGKVRYIGCSNLPVWRVADAAWTARDQGLNAFVSTQDEYSLLQRDADRERIPAAQAYGLGLIPYFPLANGMLTGKYRRGGDFAADSRFAKLPVMADRVVNERAWNIVEALSAFCEARGHSLVELAFSWLLSRPTVCSVIAGASRPSQIDANVAATGWTLSTEDLVEIDRLTLGGA